MNLTQGEQPRVVVWKKPRVDGRVVAYKIERRSDGATVTADISHNPTFVWNFAPASITRTEVEEYFKKVIADAP